MFCCKTQASALVNSQILPQAILGFSLHSLAKYMIQRDENLRDMLFIGNAEGAFNSWVTHTHELTPQWVHLLVTNERTSAQTLVHPSHNWFICRENRWGYCTW